MIGNKKKFTKLTDIFDFGKHDGCSVEYVLDNDPSYLLWLDRDGVAEISQDILDDAEENVNLERDDDDYPGANYSSYYED